MPTIYIRGANTTAQWYQDDFPGASVFPRIDKFLLHTTETGGWPGYGAGASAPTATYYPKWRQIRQHFGINRSARALRDPSFTAVRENRDNVFQLEIICYSQYSLAVERGGLWVGDLTDTHMRDIAAIILQCHRDWDLPLTSSVTWREGRKTYYNDVRLTGPQFDAYRGILGHVHASGNDHWDPGGFRYSKLADALKYQLANHPVYGGGGVTIPPPGGGTDFDPEEDMSYADWPYEDRKRLCDDIANYVWGASEHSQFVSPENGNNYPSRSYLVGAHNRAGDAVHQTQWVRSDGSGLRAGIISAVTEVVTAAVAGIPGVDTEQLAADVAAAVARLEADGEPVNPT